MRPANVHTTLVLLLLIAVAGGCSDSSAPDQSRSGRISPLPVIHGKTSLDEIVSAAGPRLLLFDLYADWCAPCKELEPILEEIAWQKREVADVYKINIDRNQALAEFFQVQAIPAVVYVKEGTIVYRITGLRTKDDYLAAIRSFTPR